MAEEKQETVCQKRSPCKRLKYASQSYAGGYTCSQAVFCTFAEDMGLWEETAYRITVDS